MDVYLRKVHHPQARNNFRVILKLDDDEIEIGSIGTQTTTAINSVRTIWTWGIDGAVPMRSLESEGQGKDFCDCRRQFEAAWERFAADEAKLAAFLKAKRRRRPASRS